MKLSSLTTPPFSLLNKLSCFKTNYNNFQSDDDQQNKFKRSTNHLTTPYSLTNASQCNSSEAMYLPSSTTPPRPLQNEQPLTPSLPTQLTVPPRAQCSQTNLSQCNSSEGTYLPSSTAPPRLETTANNINREPLTPAPISPLVENAVQIQIQHLEEKVNQQAAELDNLIKIKNYPSQYVNNF